PRVGADPQHVVGTRRRAHFDLATHTRGGGVALIEHGPEAAGTDDDIIEIAELDIAQRIDLPVTAPQETQACILPLLPTVRTGKTQRAIVAENRDSRLDFAVPADRRDTVQADRPVLVA